MATADRTAGPSTSLSSPDLDLPRVWQLTRGAGQRVAVIDTGVRGTDSCATWSPAATMCPRGDGTQDCDAHGTVVAGIIAAEPQLRERPLQRRRTRRDGDQYPPVQRQIRAQTATGPPAGVGDVHTMAKAVRTAADLGASVINISSVACVPADAALDDRALGAALAYAVDVKNAVVVARRVTPAAPAQCPPQSPEPPGTPRGHGQPGLVRRLRLDGRFGEYRRRAVGLHPARTVGGCRRTRRGGDIAQPGRRRYGESLDGAGSIRAAIRYQLCHTRRQRDGRADPVEFPDNDRTSGDATHRIDCTPSTRWPRSDRRRRSGRCRWPRSAPTPPRAPAGRPESAAITAPTAVRRAHRRSGRSRSPRFDVPAVLGVALVPASRGSLAVRGRSGIR